MLLTDAEILEMCHMAREAALELSLFVGPRASWETGATAVSGAGKVLGAQHRGQDQLAYALEDVLRGVSLGLRGVLVADAGLLWVLRDLKAKGELPEDLVLKVSVQLAAANAAAVKAMEDLGADTYNVPTDLSLAQFAAIRAVADLPLDVYVEVPDDFGGFVRHYEIPDLVRVASPVFVKFGLRNAPNIYPSGTHLEATAVALGRERVRRARIGQEMLGRYYPRGRDHPAGRDLPRLAGRRRGKGEGMKITHVDTFVVGTEWRNLTIVRAHTDEGLTGLGEARMVNHTDALVGYLAEAAPRHLVGHDPFRIEELVKKMGRDDFSRAGEVMSSGIAMFETACWDIVGKALDQPVYNLLGGPVQGQGQGLRQRLVPGRAHARGVPRGREEGRGARVQGA